MPLYDFACACGHTFEARTTTPEQHPICPRCHLMDTTRLPSAPMGVVFRGSGFYATDHPRKQ